MIHIHSASSSSVDYGFSLYPTFISLSLSLSLSPPRDYPMLLIEEYMNNGDLLGVLKDHRPSMPLPAQLNFAFQVADGMRYLADEL